MTALAAPLTIAHRLAPPALDRRTRAIVLVVGGALLTAVAAQVSLHLPWTPVPVTGQTLAVLLLGASLGMRLGAASQMLYVVLGAIGLPFYADGQGGWTAATGSTAGYLVGFVVAAALVGHLAERRQDRSPMTAMPSILAGTAIIYVLGAGWLALRVGLSGSEAFELGVRPFLAGDAGKVVLIGLGLPAAWRVVGER